MLEVRIVVGGEVVKRTEVTESMYGTLLQMAAAMRREKPDAVLLVSELEGEIARMVWSDGAIRMDALIGKVFRFIEDDGDLPSDSLLSYMEDWKDTPLRAS